jgi:hypothetical protein
LKAVKLDATKEGKMVLVLNGASCHEGTWRSGGTDPLYLQNDTIDVFIESKIRRLS